MDTEASRQLILDYYSAVETGDTSAVERILAEDVEWVPPVSAPLDGPFRGRATILDEMHKAADRFFDLTQAQGGPSKLIADGDTVVAIYDLRCKAVNGRDYSNRYIWIFTCSDGRISRMEEHTDTLKFHRIVMER